MVEVNNTLISVIIPVYKVERYLRRCIESVINQTYTNLEIILVDDSSPDNCPTICDEYAAKDKRIKVIHKKNGGLSDARNAGLNICKGEFITFIDSDDWITHQYIEILLEIMIKENADIVIGENEIAYNNKKLSKQKKPFKTTNYTKEESLVALFKKNLISHTVSWGKLYKRNLFNDLRFPIRRFHEDEFTTYKLFYNSKKVSYTTETLYFYQQRLDSITSHSHSEDFILAKEQQITFLLQANLTNIIPFILSSLCWFQLRTLWELHKKGNSTIKQDIIKDLKRNSCNPFFKDITFRHKAFLAFFIRHPQFYILYKQWTEKTLRSTHISF